MLSNDKVESEEIIGFSCEVSTCSSEANPFGLYDWSNRYEKVSQL